MPSYGFNTGWLNFATGFSIFNLKKSKLISMSWMFGETVKYTLFYVADSAVLNSSCLEIKMSNLSLLLAGRAELFLLNFKVCPLIFLVDFPKFPCPLFSFRQCLDILLCSRCIYLDWNVVCVFSKPVSYFLSSDLFSIPSFIVFDKRVRTSFPLVAWEVKCSSVQKWKRHTGFSCIFFQLVVYPRRA